MWTLDNIKAQNIYSFKELDFSPRQGCTTLVFGHNLDNESQKSNGSGKSALIEIIAVGITGDSLRNVKADEIVNDASDEGYICLSFSNTESDSTFQVERTLSRKNPQQIVVTLNGSQVVQPSVLEYNKYVLEMLGLTRDDLFSNYILSKFKYTSFLCASDKDKKELINRFSNGSMVDECIEALRSDMAAVKIRFNEAEKVVATYQGKVEAIDEQIAVIQTEFQAKENRKNEIIAAHNESIARFRSQIREAKESITTLDSLLDIQDNTDAQLRSLEESAVNVSEAYQQIVVLLKDAQVASVRDYEAGSKALSDELEKERKKVATSQSTLKAYEADVNRLTIDYTELSEKLKQLEASHIPVTQKIKNGISESSALIEKLNEANSNLTTQLRDLNQRLTDVNKALAGTIECPKCHHLFVLESDKSVRELQKEVESLERKIYRVSKSEKDNNATIQEEDSKVKAGRQQLRDMASEVDKMSTLVTEALTKLNRLKGTVSTLNRELTSETNRVAAIEQRILNLRQSLFDEAFEHLDLASKKAESEIESKKVNIATWEGNIESYQEAIREVKSASVEDSVRALETNKQNYSKELALAISKKEEVERELTELVAQETRFTDFKTHLANAKIESLGQITNEFLEAIGSDLRITFSGYTKLKSGKIRDKISISVLRDGIDCGSFAKMSQGEQSRANLASILALHKLTNVNCQDGKGLDLLILDEILDATDETGLSSMFDALNSLKITAMVVSHGLVQENYPYRLIVTKQNGVSTLNEDNQQ